MNGQKPMKILVAGRCGGALIAKSNQELRRVISVNENREYEILTTKKFLC
jgi:hypothetical protein